MPTPLLAVLSILFVVMLYGMGKLTAEGTRR